ncbi:MAG: phage tail protein [Verrucomicrobia bacterium]|nr:phage tail protein [Verrucomicrobiota bacterium]
MPDDGSAQSTTIWPLPAFHFEVTIGAAGALKGSFSEVTGLNSETQVIEYRHGNSPIYSPIKMPGITKVGNVTLKRGIFKSDNSFWDWFSSIQQNTIKRQNVVIALLDEKKATTMQWTLTNAWPTKLTGADLKSDGNEVAVNTIELAYETLSITNK